MTTARRWAAAGLIALALQATGGCREESPGAVSDPPESSVVDPTIEPLVAQILPAAQAVEAELGAPQAYFEINATPRLVNLWVALNDGAVAQPWTYVDGELTSREGQPADGHTFTAEALDFDPGTVLQPTRVALPDSAIELMFVEGGADGVVRYTLSVTSTGAGQLLVTVGPDGAVQSVEAN